MRVKILLLFVIAFFSFNLNVDAALCDKGHISQLKELAEQVEVSYEYIDHSEEILNGSGVYLTNMYNLRINLLSNDLYLIYQNEKYYYNDENNGAANFLVNSGNVEFTIHTKTCADYKLRTVRLELPKFNTYSLRKECQELKQYSIDVCDPWYQGIVTDSNFKSAIEDYLNSLEEDGEGWDLFFNFIKNNFLYIIGIVSIALVIIVMIIFYRKRSVLE